MSELREPVKQAQRRLWLNRWLAALGWSLAGAAGLFVLAVVIGRVGLVTHYANAILADETAPLVPTATEGPAGDKYGSELQWTEQRLNKLLLLKAQERAAWFPGAAAKLLAGLALVVSLIWTGFTRDSLSAAAARLDIAAGLKERLSTGLYCEDSRDPFARAVVADAQRVGGSVSVPRHLPLEAPGSAGYAAASLAVGLLFFWLFPAVALCGDKQERLSDQRRRADVRRVQAAINPMVDRRLKNLRERNPAVKKELEDLEPMKPAKLETPRDVLREAVKKVEKLSEKLENKRSDSELAKVNEFKKMLRRLAAQKQPNTSVGNLADALSKGDFKSAREALEALKLELAKAPKTEAEKRRIEELKKQLEQLSSRLDKIARDQKKTRDQLAKAGLNEEEIKQALEQLSDKDLSALEKQLADKGLSQEQIDKLMREIKKSCDARGAACKLAQNLAQAAEGADGSGQLSPSAGAAMFAAGEQLSEMEALEQELNQISAAMAELDSLKNGLCQGAGTGMGRYRGSGRGGGMGGRGQGEGNIAPEEVTDTGTVRRRTPVKTGRGAIISTRFVNGEQFKGEVSEEMVEATIAAEREVTDAIAREKIPRVYHSSLRKYFDYSRQALPEEKVRAAEEKVNPETP